MSWMMLDHPGWDTAATPVRTMRTPTGTWLLRAAPDYTATLVDGTGAAPLVDVYDPALLEQAPVPAGLARALGALGPVRRVRNADLWEALATAIIRQVIRAGQARRMHHQFRAAAGRPAGAVAVFPTPEAALALSEEDYDSLGMAFKRRPLQAAATAYLRHRDEWAGLTPDVLVKALQSVPRIGPWTAGAAVADYTGDFSLYPYADLAVRTWAHRADPATCWPDDEPGFAAAWRRAAGSHLSLLTVLTLAWGDRHVHHRPPSDPGSPHG